MTAKGSYIQIKVSLFSSVFPMCSVLNYYLSFSIKVSALHTDCSLCPAYRLQSVPTIQIAVSALAYRLQSVPSIQIAVSAQHIQIAVSTQHTDCSQCPAYRLQSVPSIQNTASAQHTECSQCPAYRLQSLLSNVSIHFVCKLKN